MQLRSLKLYGGMVALACAVAWSSLTAADPVERSRWHVEAGPSWWLNTHVAFGGRSTADPLLAPKTDRVYDDGFNRVDSSGNLGDGTGGLLASRTGYFAFSSDSQVDLKAGTLAMHTLQAPAGPYGGNRRPGSRPGFELTIRRSLAKDTSKRDWGVEAGIDWQKLKMNRSGSLDENLRVLTDTYALGGVVPQRGPYTGRFSPLPGDQRIGDTPTRAISSVAGTITGTGEFSASTTLIHVGPWIELIPASRLPPESESERWSVLARGGLAFLSTRASFSVNEKLQANGLTGAPLVTASGSRSRSDIGWFVGLRARRILSEHWALNAWADYLEGSMLTVANSSRFVRFDTSEVTRFGVSLEYAR